MGLVEWKCVLTMLGALSVTFPLMTMMLLLSVAKLLDFKDLVSVNHKNLLYKVDAILFIRCQSIIP